MGVALDDTSLLDGSLELTSLEVISLEPEPDPDPEPEPEPDPDPELL